MSVLKFFICFGGTGAGKTVRVATRKSPLAMWQAEFIQSELERLWPGITVELQPMSTRGDKVCKTVKLGDFSQRFSFFICIFCTGFFRIVKNCLLLQPMHFSKEILSKFWNTNKFVGEIVLRVAVICHHFF